MKKYYEDENKISECFEDVEKFIQLVKDRRQAGYKNGEVLRHIDSFEDKGITFDTCGNTMVLLNSDSQWRSWGFLRPPTNLHCKECGVKFTVEDLTQNKIRFEYKNRAVNLEEDTYHKDCYQKKLDKETKEFFDNCINDVFFPYNYVMVKIPNEYGSYDYRGPWFKVQFEDFYIRVGWRKRVIEVVYSDLSKTDLFTHRNNDTHSPGLVHCDDRETFVENLKIIYNFYENKKVFTE